MSTALDILICSSPADGHVNPAVPIAAELVSRGHRVRWYTGRAHRAAVERTGATWEPIVDAHDPADESWEQRFPQRAALTGVAGLRFDIEHLFLDEAPGQVADLRRIHAQRPVDVALVDTAFTGATMWHELGGPPFATYGISVLPIPSRDLPPLGPGRPPRRTAAARWADRRMAAMATRLLFGGVQRHHLRVRAGLGLPATSATFFDTMVSPFLYLQGSTPSFEYPRSDLPGQVHFVGPLLPSFPPMSERPAWWSQLDGSRPVVLVTQGTVAVDLDDVVSPTLAALADEDVLVIATGGAGREGVTVDVPANAHIERFVPFTDLLPHVDVMVTNGGYGGVQMALEAGVPIVVAGRTEDKPEVAARVAWSGAGIDLRVRRPTPEQVRRAVLAALHDEHHRRHARRLQADARRHDGPRRSAELVEELGATRRPVLRGASPWADRAVRGLPELGAAQHARAGSGRGWAS